MGEYTPDKWVVVKIEGGEFPLTYKVFGNWHGGYMDSSGSWKLNSGITKVTKAKKHYNFRGFSGSVSMRFVAGTMVTLRTKDNVVDSKPLNKVGVITASTVDSADFAKYGITTKDVMNYAFQLDKNKDLQRNKTLLGLVIQRYKRDTIIPNDIPIIFYQDA